MALYQDGILISGANTLPQMTLAEYNALPADQRPTYWERTDGDYDDVLAEKTDIATVESGTTASRPYSVGELVYVSGALRKVKTPIANGATFTEGTNVEVTNVSKVTEDLYTESLRNSSKTNPCNLTIKPYLGVDPSQTGKIAAAYDMAIQNSTLYIRTYDSNGELIAWFSATLAPVPI